MLKKKQEFSRQLPHQQTGANAMSYGAKWIQGAHLKKGALHREMGVPLDKKIPDKKLEKAEHSSNPLLRKRAITAETLKGLHKK
jgi:hypothetical protein